MRRVWSWQVAPRAALQQRLFRWPRREAGGRGGVRFWAGQPEALRRGGSPLATTRGTGRTGAA
eukprot:6057011-Alexandrium_andersonii.AAC.1